ncbi:MAG: ATP-binding cassette domain-containing protein [Clostridia bacterium]|nr:ATP-binding cassette domain-containing protein [Clostridia bacterium]
MAAPLIELKGIGKIYVSEGSVAVGIRGVDLSFDKGEFVAVTGKSGSGKSTLLNVISGMDSYEEGEMYVEGEPTSHYLQKDWEEYRKKYISFIFQEYNIIESFTVLQNVELALMNIDDPAARREKAQELLRRVGLEDFMNHKGSKLSGGQKQRTVIARALAKDSPVILADEPTGNLDSKTSEEIINLLREVSRDKLVIVVTHNFEQVEHCATRHIRIFDGAVESDQVLTAVTPVSDKNAEVKEEAAPETLGRTLRNGAALGRVRFGATPKLSVFLCLLMTVTALVLTVLTSVTADSKELFEKNYMFEHMKGRVIVTKEDGSVLTDDELKDAAGKTGAKSAIRFDYMLDMNSSLWISPNPNQTVSSYEYLTEYLIFRFDGPADKVKLDGGRYPEKTNEVLLYLPIAYKSAFGTGDGFTSFTLYDILSPNDMSDDTAMFCVTGISYFYDNTKNAEILFTAEGYDIASSLYYFTNNSSDFRFTYKVPAENSPEGEEITRQGYKIYVDSELPAGTYCLANIRREVKDVNGAVNVSLSGTFTNRIRSNNYYWDYYDGTYGSTHEVEGPLDGYTRLPELPDDTTVRRIAETEGNSSVYLLVSPDLLDGFMNEQYYEKSYTQATLMYRNDREAQRRTEELQKLGFIAVPSTETVEEDEIDRLLNVLAVGGLLIVWIAGVVFIALFMSLCTSRAMNANKGDIAIMRSMGIPTAVVKTSIYVQTLLALIPAFIVTAIACTVIYLIPKTNPLFPFLHVIDYLFVAVLMIGIAVVLAKRYCAKMFNESVKKTLKGGNKS